MGMNIANQLDNLRVDTGPDEFKREHIKRRERNLNILKAIGNNNPPTRVSNVVASAQQQVQQVAAGVLAEAEQKLRRRLN